MHYYEDELNNFEKGGKFLSFLAEGERDLWGEGGGVGVLRILWYLSKNRGGNVRN